MGGGVDLGVWVNKINVMVRDIYYDIVVIVLKGDGWIIIYDFLILIYGVSVVEVDLGVERMLVVEKGIEKIVVEIKSFFGILRVYDFY